jgi:hypothetical protein
MNKKNKTSQITEQYAIHIVRHSCDMITEEYVYKNRFRFQRMQKDGRWYVTYQNYIITHGQYRHDLEEWININYV